MECLNPNEIKRKAELLSYKIEAKNKYSLDEKIKDLEVNKELNEIASWSKEMASFFYSISNWEFIKEKKPERILLFKKMSEKCWDERQYFFLEPQKDRIYLDKYVGSKLTESELSKEGILYLKKGNGAYHHTESRIITEEMFLGEYIKQIYHPDSFTKSVMKFETSIEKDILKSLEDSLTKNDSYLLRCAGDILFSNGAATINFFRNYNMD